MKLHIDKQFNVLLLGSVNSLAPEFCTCTNSLCLWLIESFCRVCQRCYQDQRVRDQDQTKISTVETKTKTRQAETETKTREAETKT